MESIAARFIQLFESHGVHRNQIPRFLGHGLTLKDVQDEASLLPKLDEEILEAACERFAVRREWLDGADEQVYELHDFYKRPEDVGGFLDKLKSQNPDGDLGGLLLAPKEQEGEALVILHEIIGLIGDKGIFRYHLCNNWTFDYWKARAYLTAFVAIAWKRKVHVRGVYLAKKEIEAMAGGTTLLGGKDEVLWCPGEGKWYPEDMALKPETFLLGIDPERNNFGITSGLGLWLDLEQKGHVDTGIGAYEPASVRAQFQQELAKYAE